MSWGITRPTVSSSVARGYIRGDDWNQRHSVFAIKKDSALVLNDKICMPDLQLKERAAACLDDVLRQGKRNEARTTESGEPGGKLWPALASGLHGPRRAFVWWQGESDSTPDLLASYELKLVNLIARVRQENGDPTLLVVLVKVILNRNQPIRDAENTHRGARSERGAGRCR